MAEYRVDDVEEDQDLCIETRWEQTTEGEYLEFDRIPEEARKSSRPDVCAFVWLTERFPPTNHRDIINGAEHDEIALAVSYEQLCSLTSDEMVYLSRCGVLIEDGSLKMFA